MERGVLYDVGWFIITMSMITSTEADGDSEPPGQQGSPGAQPDAQYGEDGRWLGSSWSPPDTDSEAGQGEAGPQHAARWMRQGILPPAIRVVVRNFVCVATNARLPSAAR